MGTAPKPAIKSYRDLLVWQKAMDLVDVSDGIAKKLPREELYGLRAQIQRSAASVPANIAEGHGRRHRGDFVRHLSIASGSVKELETHFLIAVRRAYVTERDIEAGMKLCEEVGRMLAGLMRKLWQMGVTRA